MNLHARWIFPFIGGFYFLRLVFIGQLQLAPDETYYWYWAKHLDWSYLDHPPMVAYIMALFTALGGDRPFFVRLGGLICTVLAHIFIYLAAKRIRPSDDALPWVTLLILNVTLLFSAGCIIQTPDSPLLLFWAMALYAGVVILTGGGPGWWYLFGLALGLGLLSKYTMILILPCHFGFFLFSRDHRKRLFDTAPYTALLIGLIVFSPVVYWNWQHDWVSFAFQLNQGFEVDKDPILFKVGEFLGGQAGIVTPLLFIAFIFYSSWGLLRPENRRDDISLYLAFMSWPILLFFTFSTAKGSVAEPNWPAPAYIAAFLLTTLVFFRNYIKKTGHRRFIGTAAVLGLLMNLVLHIHLFYPIIPIAPENDNTRQFHGWRELGHHLNRLMEAYPSQEGYFLVANRSTTVSEAVFYTGANCTGLNLPEMEKYTFVRHPDRLKGKDALILLHHFSDGNEKQYAPYFRQLRVIGRHDYTFRGVVIDELSVTIILAKGFAGIEPSTSTNRNVSLATMME